MSWALEFNCRGIPFRLTDGWGANQHGVYFNLDNPEVVAAIKEPDMRILEILNFAADHIDEISAIAWGREYGSIEGYLDSIKHRDGGSIKRCLEIAEKVANSQFADEEMKYEAQRYIDISKRSMPKITPPPPPISSHSKTPNRDVDGYIYLIKAN